MKMKKTVFILIQLLSSFFPFYIRRLILLSQGHKIHKKAYIAPFSILLAKKIELNHKAKIKFFTVIIAHTVKIGENSTIDPLVLINGHFLQNSKLMIGKSCRIMIFSYIDLFANVTLGNNTLLGGKTMIFTHCDQSKNFMHGHNAYFGNVTIGDHVTTYWDCFIGHGVSIGNYCQVGAKSFINQNIPDNHTAVRGRTSLLKNKYPIDSSVDFQKHRFDEFQKLLTSYLNYNQLPLDDLDVIFDHQDIKNENFKKHTLIIQEGLLILKGELSWLQYLEQFLELTSITYRIKIDK